MSVAAVVLAAGAGARFVASGADAPKPLAVVRGRALVDHAITAATAAGVGEVVVVDGSTDLSDRASEGVLVLHNPEWSAGIASSLRVAIDHARDCGHDAVVVGLADQPGVTAAAWRAVASAPPEPPIAVAVYGGRRGNPVRLAASVWDLLPASGDDGARALMRERPELVREVPCSGEPWDIDTVEDLDRWS